MDRPTDKCPICSSQESNTIDQILTIMQKKTYAKNAMILDQTEIATGLYLIAKGAVKVSKISSLGKEIVLQILKTGDTFGEGSLLGQENQGNTITVIENCEIFYLSKRDLEPLLLKKPQLYQSVVASLIRWTQNLNSVIENINTPSAKDRVLLYLARLKKEQPHQNILQLDHKKHDVALMLGLRPETFSRALTELEDEGIIKMNHKQIQILAEEHLA